MKKILLVLLTVCGVGVAANAQSSNVSKFSIGPNAGYGWTTIGNIDGSKFKAAGNFGLSAVYSAAEHFGVGFDVKYSIEGAKFTEANQTNEIDLHYVRIPLKAIYFFNGYGSRARPKIFVGPSFGFLSSAKVNVPGASDIDIKDRLDKFDLGVHVGGGFNYRLVNRTWLNVDLAYTQGTKDIVHQDDATFKAEFPTKTPNDKFLNRNITLNVGVNFGL